MKGPDCALYAKLDQNDLKQAVKCTPKAVTTWFLGILTTTQKLVKAFQEIT